MFLLREPITFFLSLTKLKNLDLNNTLICAALIAHDLLTARGKLLLPGVPTHLVIENGRQGDSKSQGRRSGSKYMATFMVPF
jgi:hypothetical protein